MLAERKTVLVMHDLIIRNGLVVDGISESPYRLTLPSMAIRLARSVWFQRKAYRS